MDAFYFQKTSRGGPVKLGFLKLSPDERRLYIEQAAIQRNVSPVISVKLEFGSLTNQQPTGRHMITPWIAELFPKAFLDWQCEVMALEIERSFWEKATILHAEYHRPLDKRMPDRFSRHYADTAMLANRPEVIRAINQHDLRNKVVLWKSQFFGAHGQIMIWPNLELFALFLRLKSYLHCSATIS